jgi:hypothetical protein
LKRGGSRGRPKGTPNKVTVEARQVATGLVDDPVYRAKLVKDWRARKVNPAIEQMIWHYAKGKPVERHEVGTPGDFSKLTDEELVAQSRELAEELVQRG